MLPISEATWGELVSQNKKAAWAQNGVFSTGIGPDYQAGQGLLYVGKSAGPLGNLVGSADDQARSGEASTLWMISKRNKSAFWQFVDRVDYTRRSIAWTNVCKMDVVGGQRPPNGREWAAIAEISMKALTEELSSLRPKVTVFATSGLYAPEVQSAILDMGFEAITMPFSDGWTSIAKNEKNQVIIFTKHPQGWLSSERDRVIDLVRVHLQN